MTEIWELLPEILNLKYTCADCNIKVNIDYWLVINKCILVCQNCALIHLTLGSHISRVKCLTYPALFQDILPDNPKIENRFYWTTLELKLLKYCLLNFENLNNIWCKQVKPKCKDFNDTAIVPQRYSWDVSTNSILHVDKAIQIDFGSLSTLSYKSYSTENLKPNNTSNKLTKIRQSFNRMSGLENFNKLDSTTTTTTTNFINNPLHFHLGDDKLNYDDEATYQNDTRADHIRSKYLLLAYFDYKNLLGFELDLNPKVRYETLNLKLIENVKTDHLEKTIALLTLGADPNICVKCQEGGGGGTLSSSLDVALKFSQTLQAYLLIVWGANAVMDQKTTLPLLKAKWPLICDELLYAVTDTVFQFVDSNISTVSEESPPQTHPKTIILSKVEKQRGEGVEGPLFVRNESSTQFSVILKILGTLETAYLIQICQDLYDEIHRRELNFYVANCTTTTTTTDYYYNHEEINKRNNNKTAATADNNALNNINTTSHVCSLPVNPNFDSVRNDIRQRLSRLPEKRLKILCDLVIRNVCSRNTLYGSRYRAGADALNKTESAVDVKLNDEVKKDDKKNFTTPVGAKSEEFDDQIILLDERLTKLETSLHEYVKRNDQRFNKLSKIITKLYVNLQHVPHYNNDDDHNSNLKKASSPVITLNCSDCELCCDVKDFHDDDVNLNQFSIDICIATHISRSLKRNYENLSKTTEGSATTCLENSIQETKLLKKFLEHVSYQHETQFRSHYLGMIESLATTIDDLNDKIAHTNPIDSRLCANVIIINIEKIAQLLKNMHLK